MRVLVCGLATTKMEPPWPPSPPLGPPRGTRSSRRNARHPRPPAPAVDVNVYFVNEHRNLVISSSIHLVFPANRMTRSGTTSCPDSRAQEGSTGRMLMTRPRAPWSSNLTRPATFAKIVSSLPTAGVEARAEAATALSHDDRAAGHQIAVVSLDTEPLGIRIAAVA